MTCCMKSVKMCLIPKAIDLDINAKVVFIGKDQEEVRQKLLVWMMKQGYEVTEDMTIGQLVDILTHEGSVAVFIIKDGDLYIYDEDAYIDANGDLHLVNGCSIVDGDLVLKDT